MHTVSPLAATLEISVNHDYAEDEEAMLATAVTTATSPDLVAWHHGHICKLVKEIAGNHVHCPAQWPDDRFDVVWILDRQSASEKSWSFTQVAQCLLPDDCDEVI